MLERLIENWLDSASERSYQRCFCQMLIGQGFRIVHNTKHTPQEFGKDVIAVSPDGNLVGYQLKGNPGATLTPSQFDEIRGQLEQLGTLALGIPGYEGKVLDECYLVTNGEISELVSQQIQLLNASLVQRGHPAEKIKTITRGTLLAWSIDLGLALWPSEMEDFGNLVKLLNFQGDEIFPSKIFDPLLQHTLRLHETVPAPELRRRITSAAVMTAVALHSFSRRRNYFAEITAWTMFATYVISASEKNGLDFSRDGQESVLTARDAIYDLLGQLCEELSGSRTLVEGNPFSEFAFYRPRALLIYALMAVYWMWSEAEGWKRPERKAVVEKIVPENLPTQWLWGEAVIPHFLTYIWYRKRVAPSPAHDEMIARVLAEIMANQLQEGVEHLASPYYTVEDVVRHRYQKFLRCDDPLEGEGFERVSYVCEGLLACLVRADLKQKCQELWPNFSRLSHEGLVTEEAWRLGLFRTGDGAINETQIYPRTMQWAGLQAIANEDAAADFPAALRAHPILFLLREYFSVSRVLLRSEVPAQDVRPPTQSYRQGARRRVEG